MQSCKSVKITVTSIFNVNIKLLEIFLKNIFGFDLQQVTAKAGKTKHDKTLTQSSFHSISTDIGLGLGRVPVDGHQLASITSISSTLTAVTAVTSIPTLIP